MLTLCVYCRFTRNYTTERHAVYRLAVQFHLSTRIPETGGAWPDEFHRATNRLFGMFDHFEMLLSSGEFDLRGHSKIADIDSINESLAFAPAVAVCDLGYLFNETILLCGEQGGCR